MEIATPAGLTLVIFPNNVMSNPLKESEPWTSTSTFTCPPTVPVMVTGGAGHPPAPLGAKQTSPTTCAEPSCKRPGRRSKATVIIGIVALARRDACLAWKREPDIATVLLHGAEL